LWTWILDQAFLNDFDHYLRSNKGCENNYVVKNVKNLGKILRIGLENGWVEKDHFLGYKAKPRMLTVIIILAFWG